MGKTKILADEATTEGDKKTHVAISKNVLALVGVIIAIALIFWVVGGFSSSPQNSFAANQPQQGAQNNVQQAPQCRQVAYQDTEAYQDQECQTVPYTDTECAQQALVYSKTDFTCTREGLIGDWSVTKCTINNLDSEGGTFSVSIGAVVSGSNVGEQQSSYIYPQTSHAFKYSVKADSTACYCNEGTIPTKQVCRDVIKTRQDCHEVTKYRPVTKYRQECS